MNISKSFTKGQVLHSQCSSVAWRCEVDEEGEHRKEVTENINPLWLMNKRKRQGEGKGSGRPETLTWLAIYRLSKANWTSTRTNSEISHVIYWPRGERIIYQVAGDPGGVIYVPGSSLWEQCRREYMLPEIRFRGFANIHTKACMDIHSYTHTNT